MVMSRNQNLIPNVLFNLQLGVNFVIIMIRVSHTLSYPK